MTRILGALILTVFAAVGLVTNSQTTNKPTTNDVKIRQRMTMGGVSGVESLLYIKGQRMRNEMPGSMGFTTIMQCDLKRTVTINEILADPPEGPYAVASASMAVTASDRTLSHAGG